MTDRILFVNWDRSGMDGESDSSRKRRVVANRVAPKSVASASHTGTDYGARCCRYALMVASAAARELGLGNASTEANPP